MPMVPMSLVGSELQLYQGDGLDEQLSLEDLSRIMMLKPSPDGPPDQLTEKPKTWSESAWSFYNKCYSVVKNLRGGALNVAASLVAMGTGPDNCALKLAYVFFRFEGEDDYPYMPQCGPVHFSYSLGGAPQRFGKIQTLTVVLAALAALFHLQLL